MSGNQISFAAEAMSSPELARIANDALHGLQYSFLAAAADPDTPFKPGTVEEVFRKAVAAAKPENKARYSTKARAIAAQPSNVREASFGRYGKLDVAAYGRVGFTDATQHLSPLAIDHSKLAISLQQAAAAQKAEDAQLHAKLNVPLQPVAASPKPVIHFDLDVVKTLKFYITEVKCVNETDPEGGDDEILMGGLAVDANGVVSKINPFTVRDDFDAGELKTYASPGKEFCAFSLPNGIKGPWPKTYSATVVIAEEDGGGFYDALTDAWKIAGPKVKAMVEQGVTEAAAQEVGDTIAAIFAKIVAWIVDVFVGWIIGLFQDDLFKPGTAIAGLHTPLAPGYQSYGGWSNCQSQVGTFTFVGHGGKYTVKCYWKVDTGKLNG